jgi:chromosome segregation ATPase
VAANSGQNNQALANRELEKQNQNLVKQIESYKNKITTLTSNMQPSKSEDSLKEEMRKLQMQSQQTQNQLALQKKEFDKLQIKASLEASQIGQLRLEKLKIEEQLKKLQAETKVPAGQTAGVQQNDGELKRLQAHNQILDQQLKDTNSKIQIMEAKLTEAQKPQKVAGTGDDNSKVKVAQLENSVKKLTQDLLAAKNQVGEEKKETNKLRQEKTALQNQLDKLKKEADKAKPATPKKPGGKAA